MEQISLKIDFGKAHFDSQDLVSVPEWSLLGVTLAT